LESEGSFEVPGAGAFGERRWLVADPVANVFVIHGYREHCGRYAHVANFLNEHQYSVFSYDHRGHGTSPGKRGHIERFDYLVDDLEVDRKSVV